MSAVRYYMPPDGGNSIRLPDNTPDDFKPGRPNLVDIVEANNRVATGDWMRAAGDCICPVCGCKYSQHPNVRGYDFMTVLCNNEFVKL